MALPKELLVSTSDYRNAHITERLGMISSYLVQLAGHFVWFQEPAPFAFNLRYDEVCEH
jgi:hypothetical protein